MTQRILASGLLRTAHALAGSSASVGRPALSDLRRATSTAYYALFHQIVRDGAIDFLPKGDEAAIATVARWFTHRGILDASVKVVEAASPPRRNARRSAPEQTLLTASGGTIQPQLVQLADAFRSLQTARHNADYDGNYDPVRAVTLNHVQEADVAVRAAWSMVRAQQSPKPHRQQLHQGYATFLRLSLLYSGGPKSR